MSNNFYETLGVPANANNEEIRKKFKELSKKYHPDNNPNNPDAERRFKEIGEAYETLGNPEKKSQYDQTLGSQKEKGKGDQDIWTDFNKSNKEAKQKEKSFSSFEEDFFKRDRIEYIKFLEENEIRANKCGRTLELLKQEAHTIPGFLIYEKKVQIRNELKQLEEKCQIFDEFMEFLSENEKRANLCSKSLNKIKKDNENKRGDLSKENIEKLKRNINDTLYRLEFERRALLTKLKNKLVMNNLKIDTFLSERNLSESTIPSDYISTAIKSMELVDNINLKLFSYGITLDDFLKAKGKNLVEMRYTDLSKIYEAIFSLIKEEKFVKATDILAIDFDKKSNSHNTISWKILNLLRFVLFIILKTN